MFLRSTGVTLVSQLIPLPHYYKLFVNRTCMERRECVQVSLGAALFTARFIGNKSWKNGWSALIWQRLIYVLKKTSPANVFKLWNTFTVTTTLIDATMPPRKFFQCRSAGRRARLWPNIIAKRSTAGLTN